MSYYDKYRFLIILLKQGNFLQVSSILVKVGDWQHPYLNGFAVNFMLMIPCNGMALVLAWVQP